ncbi:hypothetical protein [Leptospira sp. GIMC2001]|uniref:hypothetical protein n=1 Tax=Leptospira sp. GIMC2001 TaxID=1513297 RepID=UPI002349AEA8|nr:hypothetical protein [Leptospira sp. GIMC2001]WCL49703.1 hypothetical protein O4O04_02470 [Leptospira sp. GIMC2001]
MFFYRKTINKRVGKDFFTPFLTLLYGFFPEDLRNWLKYNQSFDTERNLWTDPKFIGSNNILVELVSSS